MARLINPDTGGVVACEGDLADRYLSRGWALADGEAQHAVEAAPEEPPIKAEEPAEDDKPVTRRSTRRK